MALPININNLIQLKTVESERVEFKKGWNPEDVIHTTCAFANDLNNLGGGYIIIGIGTQNGKPLLPPKGLSINKIDFIQKKVLEICNKIRTPYIPVMEHAEYMKKHILILWAPGGDNRPYEAPKSLGKGNRGSVYVQWARKGTSTVQATEEDKRRLIELASRTPFDDRVNHNSNLRDFSLDEIAAYLKEVGSDLYPEINKIKLDELFRKMKVVRGSNEYLKPINVGLLMFSNNPATFFRGAEIHIIIYKDEVGDDLEEKIFRGPIHKQLRDATEYIKVNVIKEKIRKVTSKAEALRFNNYPFGAIEEALANAVFHRSYENQNVIEVSVRLDRIEVLSFPGPLPPLNNKALKRTRIVARDYRNRRIGDFLKELKLTEGRGTGIPKMRSAMENNGSPMPIFETDSDSTYFLTTLPVHPGFIDLRLNEHKISILNYCKTAKSRREILESLGLTNHYENFKRHVLPLIEAGYLDYTLPDIPKSRKQSYLTSNKGHERLGKYNR